MSSRSVRWPARLALVLILTAFLLGPVIPKAYAWNLSSIPMSITTTPGSTVAYSISVFYESGAEPPMALPIHLLVSPPELGITVDFLPSTGTLEFSSTMRVHVDSAKPPGVYNLNVWANPDGALFPGPDNRAINVQLIVEPAAPPATNWALSNPTLSPPSPNVGDPVTFSVVLTALTTSQPFPQAVNIHAVLDGSSVGGGTVTYPGPAGLAFNVHATPPWTATAGTHTIVWTVASGTPDPNPANNEASRTFTVAQPPAQFDFEVAASPAERTAAPGSSVSYAVTVSLVAGQPKLVSLALSGEPPGATGTFSPASGDTPFSSTLTLTVSGSASPGSYSLTITGNGGGKTRTTAVTLVVGPPRDFRVEVSPASLTVSQGQIASYSVDVSGLRGFSSEVSLSVSGLPSGSSGTFSVPSGAPDFTSTLTVTLPANAPTGSFTLTITAQAGGLTRLATAILTVTAAPQTQTQTLTPTTTATTESIMDLLQQNSLLLIGVLAVVIVALLAVLLRRPKAPSQPKPQEPARFCATCGKPLTYVTEYSRWYCRNCKEYR